jgi:ABC-2 type transport system permease protein
MKRRPRVAGQCPQVRPPVAGRFRGPLLALDRAQVIGTVVVAAAGLAIGWRVHTSAGQALAAFGLALLFGYAFSWLGVCMGMVLRSPEAAQQAGFLLFLPLTFVSNAFVPTQGMPGWLQAVADWNPLSALAAASRHLFGNPDPVAGVHSWPMQHPELAVALWSVLLLVIFAPLAVRLYRRKSLG